VLENLIEEETLNFTNSKEDNHGLNAEEDA